MFRAACFHVSCLWVGSGKSVHTFVETSLNEVCSEVLI